MNISSILNLPSAFVRVAVEVTPDYDIAIVGYGPVGQTMAILLGRRGWRVGVFERWPELYPRPRAVHYDDEGARIFQRLGIAEELSAITEPAATYEWQNAGGQTLLMLDRTGSGRSGWPAATMFTQPALERLLDRTAKDVPTVEVHQGFEVADIDDSGSEVRLAVWHGRERDGRFEPSGEEIEVSARYVIGCDGANSVVRARMGTPVEDLGFAYDWLIADTIPHDPALLAGVNLQRCDPRRPTTLVSGGPGRRRWEWMLVGDESRAQVENEEFVWRMLAESGVGPEQVKLERFTVYTFRARWAERWREGRMLLAGDAAHQMPPFAGQGLCSGIRDAVALDWHLDLVLRQTAPEETLDAYTSERRGQLQHAIAVSVELGKVICIADEAEAAARDEVLLSAAADPSAPPVEPPAPNLGPGIHDGEGAAGSLFPQGRVAGTLVEDTFGPGFALYVLGSELLDEETEAALGALGGTVVVIGLAHEEIYRDWFAAQNCSSALVRPDFYVFGTAADGAGTRALVARLQDALTNSDRIEEGLPT
jgi:2-polyprenyl-6-methoxyphenol hydroxylase-like FAD-dependent oxidoreductase